MNKRIVEVENLKTQFATPEGIVKSVDGISFYIDRGETLALVGESGCGKTVTSLSMMGLLPNTATVTADKFMLNSKSLSAITAEEMRALRGSEIAMVFQEPMTSLNPVYKIEKQIGDVYRAHDPHISKQEVWRRSVEMMKKVGIPKPEERLKVYPHQLSGGLRQRAMIAIALAANPTFLIADEPTTALDVTIQAQIIELLKELQHESKMSILLITHDFGVVSRLADRVAVMYAGKIVEQGTLEEIFSDPWHPYTQRLIMSIPGIKITRGERLESIPGAVPNPLKMPRGCRFASRCTQACPMCFEHEPTETVNGSHSVCCHLRG